MTPPKMTPTQNQIRASWDRLASGFDEFTTPLTMRLGDEAVRLAGVRSGMRFLDVAAGCGALSIPAARLGADVVATDIAPGMIERLDARARREGLANLEGRVMDGYALELEDDSFDVAGSQNGVSLFPDLKAGLRELVRVVKPGGRAVIVAFTSPDRAEWISSFMGALQAVVPDFTGLPTDPPPPSFQLAPPGKMRQELADAGLAEIRVEPVTWRLEIRSGAHLYDVVTHSNPIGGMLVADLTEEQRSDIREVLDGMLRERSGGGPGAVLNSEMRVGIGTK